MLHSITAIHMCLLMCASSPVQMTVSAVVAVCVCMCACMHACVHASTLKAASTLDCYLACVWLICKCLLVVHASSSVQMTMSALAATCVVSRCASTPQAATTASAAAASALTSTSCPVLVSTLFTRQTVETFMMEDPDWSVPNMSCSFGFWFWQVIAQTFTSRVCISWMPQKWMKFDRVFAKTTPLGWPLCDWFSKVLAHQELLFTPCKMHVPSTKSHYPKRVLPDSIIIMSPTLWILKAWCKPSFVMLGHHSFVVTLGSRNTETLSF